MLQTLKFMKTLGIDLSSKRRFRSEGSGEDEEDGHGLSLFYHRCHVNEPPAERLCGGGRLGIGRDDGDDDDDIHSQSHLIADSVVVEATEGNLGNKFARKDFLSLAEDGRKWPIRGGNVLDVSRPRNQSPSLHVGQDRRAEIGARAQQVISPELADGAK